MHCTHTKQFGRQICIGLIKGKYEDMNKGVLVYVYVLVGTANGVLLEFLCLPCLRKDELALQEM